MLVGFSFISLKILDAEVQKCVFCSDAPPWFFLVQVFICNSWRSGGSFCLINSSQLPYWKYIFVSSFTSLVVLLELTFAF